MTMCSTGGSASKWAGAAALSVLVLSFATSAFARPQYAAREGMYCVSCHVDPDGGGLRNGNGFSYQRGRHNFEVEPKFEEWPADPELVKGVRIGSDLRATAMSYDLSDHYDAGNAGGNDHNYPREYASFAMQGAVYLGFTPADHVVLYYSHDLGASNQKSRDWYGMLRNLTDLNLYVKAGQLRSPYGLRLDDHTPFVRGAEDYPPGEVGMMDVNPRDTYPGVEVGFVKKKVFAHVAYQDQNGTSSPNFTQFNAKMVSGRAGIAAGHLIVGVSGRWNGQGDFDEDTKATRYGAFAMFGGRKFAVVAEGDLGKDEFGSGLETHDVQGAYIQGELYLSRTVTLRAETNYMDLMLDESNEVTSVARRYGAGIELNPIPFFKVSGDIRFVSNSNLTHDSTDESWGFVQATFSY